MKEINIFLLRGLIRESAHWGEMGSLLEKQFPNANVVKIEIPGVGQYNHLPSPWKISQMVDFLRKDYLNMVSQPALKDKPNYLVSMSLGGMISTDWLTRFPYDFKKAVLINTSLKGINSLTKRLRPSILKNMYKIANSKTPLEKERNIIEMVSNDKEMYQKNTEVWSKIAEKRPVSNYNAFRQIFAGATFTPPTEKPKADILMIAGLGDRMVHPICSEEIARKWNVPLVTHPTGGHDLSLDASPWLVEQIKEFL